jgi:hypothetical protein
MVSHINEDAVDVVRQGLTGLRRMDDEMAASAATLVERLERINRLGGLFEAVSFSPQMEAFASRHLTGAAKVAV